MICLKQNDYIAFAARYALLFASTMLKGHLTSKWNLYIARYTAVVPYI